MINGKLERKDFQELKEAIAVLDVNGGGVGIILDFIEASERYFNEHEPKIPAVETSFQKVKE